MERERERSLEGERDARKYALVTRERKARGGKGESKRRKRWWGGEKERRGEGRTEAGEVEKRKRRRMVAWPCVAPNRASGGCTTPARKRSFARAQTRACGQSGTRALLQVVATGAQEIAPLPVVNPGRNFAAAVHRRIICRGDRTTAFKQIRHVHRE